MRNILKAALAVLTLLLITNSCGLYKKYERPEVEIVTFEALEQLALLSPKKGETTDIGKAPGVSGSVGGRGDDY